MNEILIHKTICTNCVMDTSDRRIQFDMNGVCDHCNDFYKNVKPSWNIDENSRKELAKIIEDKIDLSETKESLDDIYNNDFQILKESGQGHPHYNEIRRLYTIMKTKYKYVI